MAMGRPREFDKDKERRNLQAEAVAHVHVQAEVDRMAAEGRLPEPASIDFIRRHKDVPFFLYLPHFAVHAPLQAKKELIQKFKPKPPVGGHSNPTYAAMIYSVDESVGRVMTVLASASMSR